MPESKRIARIDVTDAPDVEQTLREQFGDRVTFILETAPSQDDLLQQLEQARREPFAPTRCQAVIDIARAMEEPQRGEWLRKAVNDAIKSRLARRDVIRLIERTGEIDIAFELGYDHAACKMAVAVCDVQSALKIGSPEMRFTALLEIYERTQKKRLLAPMLRVAQANQNVSKRNGALLRAAQATGDRRFAEAVATPLYVARCYLAIAEKSGAKEDLLQSALNGARAIGGPMERCRYLVKIAEVFSDTCDVSDIIQEARDLADAHRMPNWLTRRLEELSGSR